MPLPNGNVCAKDLFCTCFPALCGRRAYRFLLNIKYLYMGELFPLEKAVVSVYNYNSMVGGIQTKGPAIPIHCDILSNAVAGGPPAFSQCLHLTLKSWQMSLFSAVLPEFYIKLGGV